MLSSSGKAAGRPPEVADVEGGQTHNSRFVRANTEFVEKCRRVIRGMSRQSLMYRMLKEELTARGNWKAKPRGKPLRGGYKGVMPFRAQSGSHFEDDFPAEENLKAVSVRTNSQFSADIERRLAEAVRVEL